LIFSRFWVVGINAWGWKGRFEKWKSMY